MSDYKIAPLTWLNTKYSQINHNHELYEEKYVNRITDTPYYTHTEQIWNEETQQYYDITISQYLNLEDYEMEFSIENFNELTGNKNQIEMLIDNNYWIFIKEMTNGNGLWFYTFDRSGDVWDTLALVNDCNYIEVAEKEITTEEPEIGISKNAEIKVNVNVNRIIFNVFENDTLTNTIRIFLDNGGYTYRTNVEIESVNFEGFIITDRVSYLKPKIFTINDKIDDDGVVYYYDLGKYGKVNYNVTFNEDGQYFSIDGLGVYITYYNNVIYDGDYTDDKPIKQGNEINIEVLLNNNGVIIILSENIIKLGGRERDVYHNGSYQTLNVIGTIDEVGNRATEEEINQLWNNVSNKENTNNKITQWSNSPSNTKYPSEKLVKDSLDGKQEKLVSGNNLRTLDGIDLLGEGDIAIDVSRNSSSALFEDACDSASGLSDYGSSVAVRGSSSTMTIEYDSTENAYKCSGSNNYYAMIPIPILNDEDGYVLSADIKGQSIGTNAIGLCINNRNDTTSYSYAVWMESMNKVVGKQFSLNSDGTVNQYGLSLSTNKYYRIELTVNGDSLTGKLYDGNTVLATDTTTLTVENRQVGIFLLTQNGTTNSTCYVKNIKAENLGSGSTIIFEDDFTGSTLDSNWIPFGASCTTTVSDGNLALYKSNGSNGGIYYNQQVTGNYKVTIEYVSGAYDNYAIGMKRNTNDNGFFLYELQPKYAYQYDNFLDTGSITNTQYSSSVSNSYSSATTVVFEVTKDTEVKVYINGILKNTYTIQGTTTDGYIGIFQCCGRTTTISSIKVETFGGSTIIFKDNCSVDNTSDYGSSIPLRNGSSTLAYNSDGYYTITNNSYNSESFIPITELTGLTTDFTFEYDSYIQQVGGSSGLVIYNSSTAWVKLTDDGDSTKRTWYGYNNGSFHETGYNGNQTTYQKWVHYKYTVVGTTFSIEISYNGNVVWSHTENIHFTRNSSTKIGLDSEWASNTVTRYKNIVVKTNNKKLYLGDSIMTMINTALEHIITNWEDYN